MTIAETITLLERAADFLGGDKELNLWCGPEVYQLANRDYFDITEHVSLDGKALSLEIQEMPDKEV